MSFGVHNASSAALSDLTQGQVRQIAQDNRAGRTRRLACVTPRYPRRIAEALAVEFGYEAHVWMRSAILANSHECEVAARDTAVKAAHFGLMALERS